MRQKSQCIDKKQMIFGEQAEGGHSGKEVLQLYVSRVKKELKKMGCWHRF